MNLRVSHVFYLDWILLNDWALRRTTIMLRLAASAAADGGGEEAARRRRQKDFTSPREKQWEI